MANTLKFGSGQWATKVGSTLAYNDENGNFKPLPFNFTRSTSATRVNKDGLIEVVTNDKPRIDFKDDSNGALKLEPSRSNLITYSEDFSQGYWSKSRATILSNQTISPDGTLTADLLTITDTPENYAQTNVSITVSGAIQTVSCFVKKGTNDFAHILLWDTSSNGSRQWFDVNNGTVGSSTIFGSGISVNSASIENYGNGWFRCIVVFNCSLTSVRTRISASNGDGQTNGTIGKTIFIWGYQLESNSSYATSYIPTQGAISTRVAEVCNGAGDVNTFNDSEGVLFAEISALDDDLTFRLISLSNGTTSNRLSLGYRSTSNAIYCEIRNETVTQAFLLGTVDDIKNSSKVAVKYKENDFALWINGIEVSTDDSGLTPLNLSELNLDSGQKTASFFYGNTKQIQYFPTALNDSDLETLTSWDSFSDMANSQLYTIK
jgi:hypothetical protein